jgi:hypothetical protein
VGRGDAGRDAAVTAAGEKERLARLARWLPEIERGELDFGRWEGGDRLPNGSIQMPYYSFSERALALIGDMPIEVFDWGSWMQTDEARALLADHERIAEATPEQLVKLCTALRRGDRFGEGTLAWAFESGLLVRIVRRAVALAG